MRLVRRGLTGEGNIHISSKGLAVHGELELKLPGLPDDSQQLAEATHPTVPTFLMTPKTEESDMTKVAFVLARDRDEGVGEQSASWS